MQFSLPQEPFNQVRLEFKGYVTLNNFVRNFRSQKESSISEIFEALNYRPRSYVPAIAILIFGCYGYKNFPITEIEIDETQLIRLTLPELSSWRNQIENLRYFCLNPTEINQSNLIESYQSPLPILGLQSFLSVCGAICSEEEKFRNRRKILYVLRLLIFRALLRNETEDLKVLKRMADKYVCYSFTPESFSISEIVTAVYEHTTKSVRGSYISWIAISIFSSFGCETYPAPIVDTDPLSILQNAEYAKLFRLGESNDNESLMHHQTIAILQSLQQEIL